MRIGKQVGDVQRRQRLKHVIEKIGQRVPDSKEIKLGHTAGGKIERQQQQGPAKGVALLSRADLLVIAFEFGMGIIHASLCLQRVAAARETGRATAPGRD